MSQLTVDVPLTKEVHNETGEGHRSTTVIQSASRVFAGGRAQGGALVLAV